MAENRSRFSICCKNLAETKPDAGRANKWAAKAFLAEVYMQQHKYAEALPLLTDCISNGVTANGEKYALTINTMIISIRIRRAALNLYSRFNIPLMTVHEWA